MFRFSFAKRRYSITEKPPISLLIACRNEEDNLEKNLPKLLDQKYPIFELILVDDASTDNTLSVIKAFAEKNDRVQYESILKTSSYTGNKKNAVTKAVQNASYEHLLLTDADCEPASKYWIQNIATQFSEEVQLVLGYGAYKKSTTWLNKLIRYETVLTAWQYFSYGLLGIPYMGVGRNMAYTKSMFKYAKGFQHHQHIKSGDDDLFINQIANKNNTSFCWWLESHTISEPKKTFANWFQQKRRHITTANLYKPIHQVLLGFFYLSQFLFYLLAIFLLVAAYNSQLVLVLIGFRFVVYYLCLIPTTSKLNEKDLIFFAPFLEFFLVVLQLCIFINNLLQKPAKW